MSDVQVYTTDYCPYCTRAKSLLQRRGIPFEEINVEGDPEKRWRDCRVVDISSAGAGLELLDATPEETEGKRIILAVQLRAEVRHTRTSNDRVRVGMQFVELSEGERRYLASLAELDARW